MHTQSQEETEEPRMEYQLETGAIQTNTAAESTDVEQK